MTRIFRLADGTLARVTETRTGILVTPASGTTFAVAAIL